MLQSLIKFFKQNKKSQNFYEVIGTQNGVEELVHNFYNTMEQDPYAVDCLNTHELINGKIPLPIQEKLIFFITGWLGGPNLFIERYGPPRMRMRHMHINIGSKEKEQWLYCMKKAIDMHSIKIDSNNKLKLLNSFTALAMRIKNQEN